MTTAGMDDSGEPAQIQQQRTMCPAVPRSR
jgi:hypothetical protein